MLEEPPVADCWAGKGWNSFYAYTVKNDLRLTDALSCFLIREMGIFCVWV